MKTEQTFVTKTSNVTIAQSPGALPVARSVSPLLGVVNRVECGQDYSVVRGGLVDGSDHGNLLVLNAEVESLALLLPFPAASPHATTRHTVCLRMR